MSQQKNTESLSIQKAAEILGVTAMTLRRWDANGIFTPSRTTGNQRRYLLSDVLSYKSTYNKKFQANSAPVVSQPDTVVQQTENRQKESSRNDTGKKDHAFYDVLSMDDVINPFYVSRTRKLIAGAFIFLFFLTLSAYLGSRIGTVRNQDQASVLGVTETIQPQFFSDITEGAVLAAADDSKQYKMSINIPAEFYAGLTVDGTSQFNGDVTISGNVYADNLGGYLTGLTAGTGISVGSGTKPTITNTGVTSFGGATGAVTLTAGTGITISGTTISASTTTSSTSTSTDSLITVAKGGTGLTSYTIGDMLYASAGTTLSKLTIGTTGKVLMVAGGLPVWGDITGDVCTNCLIDDPAAAQTVIPAADITGFSVRGADAGTADIFTLKNFGGTETYFQVTSAGNLVLGDSTSNTITFNARVNSDIEPSMGSQYDLGSSVRRWRNVYGDTANFTNFTTEHASISGTTASDFLINSDYTGDDGESSTLTFERGSPAVNAALLWNTTDNSIPFHVFELNAPLFVNPDTGVTSSGTAALMVNQPFAEDIFTASASGVNKFVIKNSGNVGIGTTAPTDKLDVAGGVKIGASYAGIATTAPTNGLLVQGNVGIGTNNLSSVTRLGQNLAIVEADAGDYGGLSLSNFSGGSRTTLLDFNKSNSGVIGTQSIVAKGNTLGAIVFRGSDGGDFENAAGISVIVDETPGVNDMPGALVFATSPDGTTASLERMRITNAGYLGIGMTAPTSLIHGYTSSWNASNYTYTFENHDAVAVNGNTMLVRGGGNLSTAKTFIVQDWGGNTDFSVMGNGYVGIGTSSPVGNLDISNSSNAATTPLFSIRSAFNTVGNYGMIRFGDVSQTTTYQKGAIIYESVSNSSRGKIHLALNNDDTSANVALTDARLTILSSGNLGIGTTAPTNFLDVAGGVKIGASYAGMSTTAPTNGLLVQGWVGVGTSRPFGSLQVKGTSAVNWGGIGTTHQNSYGTATIGSGGAGGSLWVHTPSLYAGDELGYESGFAVDGSYPAGHNVQGQSIINLKAYGVNHTGAPYGSQMAFFTTNTTTLNEVMRLTRDGDVGIGTTNPGSLLHLESASGPTLTIKGTDIGSISTISLNDRRTTDGYNRLVNLSNDGRLFRINTTESADVFAITQAGKVGIGTTNPTATLVVSGTDTSFNISTMYLTAPTDTTANLRISANNGAASADMTYIKQHKGGPFVIYPTNGTITGLAINTSGYVGIGTTNPTFQLQTTGDAYIGTSLQAGYGRTKLYYDGNDADVIASIGKLYLSTNSTHQLTINTSGNVGIGTTNPIQKFEVAGNAMLGNGNSLYWRDGGSNYSAYMKNSGYNLSLGIYQNTEVMRITTAGYVGVGSSTPTDKLDIAGGVKIGASYAGMSTTAPTNGMLVEGRVGIGTTAVNANYLMDVRGNIIQSGNGTHSGIYMDSDANATFTLDRGGSNRLSFIRYYSAGAGKYGVGMNANSDNFHIANSNFSSTYLTINSSGYVGIGTSSPTNLLDVAGGVKIGASYAGMSTTAPTNGLLVEGNVGIGTTQPGYKFQVQVDDSNQGHVASDGTWSNTSDARLKTNVLTLNGGLGTILGLRPVTYNSISDPTGEQSGLRMGFIAQEVEQLLPSVVDTDPTTGYKSISYTRFIPYLTSAIQELSSTVNSFSGATLSGNLASGGSHLQEEHQDFANIFNTATSSTEFNIASLSGTTLQASDSARLFLQEYMQDFSSTLSTWLTDLVIDGYALFKRSVIFAQTVLFQSPVQFAGTVLFEKRVQFSDTDMAGIAIIPKWGTQVDVVFEKPFEKKPVITFSLIVDSATDSAFLAERSHIAVTNSSERGFSLVLEAPLTRDVSYNWIALPVTNVKTTVGKRIDQSVLGETTSEATASGSGTPTLTVTPTPSPIPLVSDVPNATDTGTPVVFPTQN